MAALVPCQASRQVAAAGSDWTGSPVNQFVRTNEAAAEGKDDRDCVALSDARRDRKVAHGRIVAPPWVWNGPVKGQRDPLAGVWNVPSLRCGTGPPGSSGYHEEHWRCPMGSPVSCQWPAHARDAVRPAAPGAPHGSL